MDQQQSHQRIGRTDLFQVLAYEDGGVDNVFFQKLSKPFKQRAAMRIDYDLEWLVAGMVALAPPKDIQKSSHHNSAPLILNTCAIGTSRLP